MIVKFKPELPEAVVKETDTGHLDVRCPICGSPFGDYVRLNGHSTIYRCKNVFCRNLYVQK